jgi:hypothetical protein
MCHQTISVNHIRGIARAIHRFLAVISTLVNYRNISSTLSLDHIILKETEKPNNTSQSNCLIEQLSEENNPTRGTGRVAEFATIGRFQAVMT